MISKALSGIRHDRREPGVDRQALAFGRLDLIGALQRLVDALCQFRPGICGVERLVGVHRRCRVGIRRHLPAGEIDRLQAGADHLHGLIARQRAQRIDEVLLPDQLPQPVGSHFGQAVPDLHGAAQPNHILRRIGPLDPLEAAFRRRRDKVVKVCHLWFSPLLPIHWRSPWHL
jgi:hypothetical protein